MITPRGYAVVVSGYAVYKRDGVPHDGELALQLLMDDDHSSWVLRSCKWDTVNRPVGERIRLTFETEIQAAGNGIINCAYQLTATGWLAHMPTLDEISADFD